jgi:hypothetical protein
MNKNIERATWEDTVMYSERPLMFKQKALQIMIMILLTSFIIALAGSMIWGNVGFAELVGSFF